MINRKIKTPRDCAVSVLFFLVLLGCTVGAVYLLVDADLNAVQYDCHRTTYIAKGI